MKQENGQNKMWVDPQNTDKQWKNRTPVKYSWNGAEHWTITMETDTYKLQESNSNRLWRNSPEEEKSIKIHKK